MLKKMLNIIKYEWLRRWKFFLAGLAVFTLANIDLVSRIIIKGEPLDALRASDCRFVYHG